MMNITWDQVSGFLSGATALGIVAHAVATFPTPKNQYGQWALGIVKYVVGQRVTAVNAFNGIQSEVTAVTTQQKESLLDGSHMVVTKDAKGMLKPVTSEQAPV